MFGQAGCGIGALIYSPSNRSAQIIGATTNGSSGIRYSAISSGTSKCKQDPPNEQIQQEAFMMENYSQIAKDIAAGGGSTLNGLADLLGCGQDVLPVFNSVLQIHFKTIFVQPGAMAALDELKSVVLSTDLLVKNCRKTAFFATGGDSR